MLENFKKNFKSHIDSTTDFALKIANKMGLNPSEKKQLELACVFHDYGKILIPPELINKPGVLTPEEKAVVDLHAELGAELLSSAGMDKRVVQLIRNHHNPMSENIDILGQILSVADEMSALIEPRPYKGTLSLAAAFSIIDKDVNEGRLNEKVVNALKEVLSFPKTA